MLRKRRPRVKRFAAGVEASGMDYVDLGSSGLRISRLALGGNVFGWTADEATSFRILDAYVEAGGNLIDTADVYSRWVPGHTGGESETIIGRWLARRGRRDDVLIATKVGAEFKDASGLRPERIRAGVDASLRRLQTGVIDLYQTHYDDLHTPLVEVLGTLGELIAAGKVRAIGASNITADRLADALRVSAQHQLPRYESLQPHYNLLDRASFEGALQDLCIQHAIGVIPYYALARGFLTGKYRTAADFAGSARGGGAKQYLNPRGLRVLAALDEIAARYHATPARVALGWLAAQPAIAAPIASATATGQVTDLVAGVTLHFEPADLHALTAAGHE